MNRRKILSAFLFLIATVAMLGFIKPDDGPIEKIANQLGKWLSNNPPEKVYLQLDKPYYSAGDDIWFKAYITIGNEHKLSVLSGVLNVELIDERDSIKRHIKLPVKYGLCWGDFALPDTLPEGSYRIRAYTNYMRNAGEDYFFDERINIVNAVNNQIFTQTNYTYSSENGQKKVNAVITYSDANNVAYINKQVKYSIELNSKLIVKGKGITDDKGNLHISFIDPSASPVNSGRIITTLLTNRNEAVTKEIPIKTTSADVDVQFFPESGSLVDGITSKVAFKSVGVDGLGADIKGTITDDKNNIITTFASEHLGMGIFNLLPVEGVNYKANIICADGSEKTVYLPKAMDRGYVLSINMDDPNRVNVRISANRSTIIDKQNDTLSLVAQAGGQVVYAANSKPGGGSFTAVIPANRFPSGIVQFTLFTSKGEPLNERLVFIQNPDQLKLNITAANETYSPRQKVKLQLSAQNNDSKPVTGSFSVAVTDETKVPVDEDSENSIMADILLTSDLRGYIEKPNYYFNHINDTTRANLDVLMLTQGYHRFEWKEILNDRFPAWVYQPEKTLEISGHIKTSGGKPVVHGKVNLLSTSKGGFFTDTVTDENGRFVFDNLAFGDSIKFVIEARTLKDRKNVTIDLDNIKQQDATADKTFPDLLVNVNSHFAAYLQSSKNLFDEQLKFGLAKRTIVLKEVVIKDTRPALKYSANLNGPGNADQVVTSDQLELCPDLQTCLEGRLLGVTFRNGLPYSTRGGAMTINLDGIFVTGDELNSIVPSEIESVEVLRSVAYYAIYGSQAGRGGVLVITTKRGDDANKELYRQPAPGIIIYSPIGYYKAREFYSPQYDDPKTNTAIADLRSTIYWNPNLVTDTDGKASVEYFNAGGKGTYRVVVEGIAIDGKIGHQVYRYKVE